jgi:hypothetical protein
MLHTYNGPSLKQDCKISYSWDIRGLFLKSPVTINTNCSQNAGFSCQFRWHKQKTACFKGLISSNTSTYVNAATKIRILQATGHCLSRWATISFSRRTRLQAVNFVLNRMSAETVGYTQCARFPVLSVQLHIHNPTCRSLNAGDNLCAALLINRTDTL